MTQRRIILFRGMNTGGVRAPVTEQRAMASDLGYGDPRTLLASGNLVVDSDAAPADMEAAVEAETERRFGRRIGAVVRTADQWTALLAANPFPAEAAREPSKLLVMAMKDGVKPGAVEAVRAFAADDERVAATDGALWFWHPDGIGRSRMAEKAQPRLIGLGTARNWATALKIDALLSR